MATSGDANQLRDIVEIAEIQYRSALVKQLKFKVCHAYYDTYNIPSNLQPRFSIRLTSGDNFGKTIVANEVIPANHKLGEIYSSIVNFGGLFITYLK
ncbi:hypothetical protein BUALT_Bualt01G0205300 [Buddleja alternifolia]|uniref:Expansin-like CBD domain-containing protein n=1 Tax=Buddleja alternifolia TaxID=168488 RepID=A0AAV6YCY0_9LAMI|nr:hypothetical protein BUALT_Bualt01G0205300 [Buddleja alternifolia]